MSRIRRDVSDLELRADMLVSVAAFAGAHGLQDFVRALIRREEVKDSPIFQDFFAEERAEAHAQGRAEGLAEGLAEGRAAAILRVLARRFGDVTEPDRQAILALRDLVELDRLFDLALDARSLEDFRTRLPKS